MVRIVKMLSLLGVSAAFICMTPQIAQATVLPRPHAEKIRATHAPGTPSLKASQVTSSSITLTWSAVQGASKYELYRNGYLHDVTKSRSLVDKHLAAHTKYTYTIYAMNAYGRSEKRSITVWTDYNAVPSTPSGLKATSITQTAVTLKWNSASRAQKYTILNDGHVVGNTTGTSFTVKGLSPQIGYTFTVYASNTRGSSHSASLHVSTLAAPMTVNQTEGSQSTATPTSTSQSETTAVQPVSTTPSTSGVTSGIIVNGSATESWFDNGKDVTLQSLTYNPADNLIPLQGRVNSTSNHNDLVAIVYNASENQQWIYSIPVNSAGDFSDTITVPYHGDDSIWIGIPEDAAGQDFSINNNTSAAMAFSDSKADLSATQMALLQSWMVNYNESPSILQTAQAITASATTTTAKVEAVSNWVSENIWYNFSEANTNKVVWQQATQTLSVRSGVCQDEAAVAAAYLRALGIPTRVVDGEAYDPSTGQKPWRARVGRGLDRIGLDYVRSYLGSELYRGTSKVQCHSETEFNLGYVVQHECLHI